MNLGVARWVCGVYLVRGELRGESPISEICREEGIKRYSITDSGSRHYGSHVGKNYIDFLLDAQEVMFVLQIAILLDT